MPILVKLVIESAVLFYGLELALNLFLLISIAVVRFAPTLENGWVRITFEVNTLDLGFRILCEVCIEFSFESYLLLGLAKLFIGDEATSS